MNEIAIPGFFVPFKIKSIVWIEGCGNYSWIYLEDGERHLACVTLKWFEDKLDRFLRLHKSVLVNFAYLDDVRNHSAILTTGIELSISRRRYTHLRRSYRSMSEKC